MAVLSFSLTPESTARVYEALTCLAKFGDTVALEARGEKLTLTSLNSSRTAYASFALDAQVFFVNYDFNHLTTATNGGDRFTCQLFNKALQSVFKGRTSDSRGRETAIERCDVSIQDQPDKTECRIVIKMFSKHGMTKTFRLTYESAQVMHALFDRTAATQGWRISSRIMREYIEYFGSKTEQLDLVAQDGKVVFTSFTEKIQDGKGVLKQPLETSITIHTDDFEDFHLQENVHIIISVNDFKAIVSHAETLRGPISARFSHSSRPLQFSYQNFGINCEFTLMTRGDPREVTSTPNPNFISNRSASVQPSQGPRCSGSRAPSEMQPPARPGARKPLSSQSQRPSLREQAQATADDEDNDPDPNSLFVPLIGGEDEQGWDSPNYEEEEMLGWDANDDNLSASMRPTIRDLDRSAAPSTRSGRASQSQEGLPPTQRLSELHGLFD